jgi:CO/xanthine dehydrogenase Mo-binding subunit
MTTYNTIGRSLPPYDGRAKTMGATRYATDVQRPGMVHGRLVLSPHPHARILAIDKTAALAQPGVVAVLTAEEMPAITPRNRPRLLLARERVMFTGQPVALVLAETEAAAGDGAQLVEVEYEPLPAAVTIEQALAADAPLVWPAGLPGDTGEAGAHGADLGDGAKEERPGNVSRRRNFQRGDVTTGFAAADVVIERHFSTQRLHQSYLEPHATVAEYDQATGSLTVWTSTQAQFWLREELANIMDMAESDVRVVGMTVGGAFGGKFVLYEPLVALAARQVGRPVRLVLSRLEEMLAGNPAPSAQMWVKLGAKQDGTLSALEAEMIFEVGCFPNPHDIGAFLVGSYYQIPHLEIRYLELFTFKTSVGAYRAPGTPQPTFALESVVDEIAARLHLDPLALRLKNVSEPGSLMANNKPWAGMGMRQVLEKMAAQPAWQQRAEARTAGRGVGVAIGGWPGGAEPAAATCTLNRDGLLHVQVGSIDLTGTMNGFRLMAAEAFGVEPDRVKIVQEDTNSAPFAGATGGSKITFTMGPAIVQAAKEARAQTLQIAAEEFEADIADLEIVDGKVQVRGVPDKAMPLAEIAGKAMGFDGRYPPIVAHGRHYTGTAAPAFCAQLAEVSVDPETGQVQVHRLVVVQDVGQVINPDGAAGQLLGGATQGLGLALYEAMVHDDRGQLLTGTWLEYAVPHAEQVASIMEAVFVEVPSEVGPFGARGVGEPPIIATAGAIANAIADATGCRPADLPMSAPSILALLNGS